ncbi:hypothetical protein ACFLTE_10080 [Bacteroidota bacterium]
MLFIKKKYITLFIASIFILNSCEDFFSPEEETGDQRDKINDLWYCTEESEIYGTTSYDEVFIYNHPSDSSSIYIENFYNLGENNRIKAQLSEKTILINNGYIDEHIVNGYGHINSSFTQIDWNYSVEHPDGEMDNVTAVYIKI